MIIPQVGVAFFDSGVGGLTVLAECEKRLPNEKFYYYGDNRHAPYGNLSKEQMRPYVLRAFDTFARLRVKAAVIACNTVTALFAEELRARYPFPIIGAEPAVGVGAKVGGEIFVLTTRATYESVRFQKLCQKAAERYPQSLVKAFACDGLAGEIETHIGETGHDYAPLLPKGAPAAVILGCTHYIYIKEYIRAYYGCPVFHGNEGIAARLAAVLEQINARKQGFTTTDELLLTKNRDEKPLTADFVEILPSKLKTRRVKKEKGNKTNKCSYLKFKNVRKYRGKMKIRAVRFLGESGQKNLKIYERMFVL